MQWKKRRRRKEKNGRRAKIYANATFVHATTSHTTNHAMLKYKSKWETKGKKGKWRRGEEEKTNTLRHRTCRGS